MIAPTLAARALSMAFAGTDEAHDREFAAAATRYRTAMLTTLNGELASSGRFNTFDYTRGRDLWEKVPPFDYDVPPARLGAVATRVERRRARGLAAGGGDRRGVVGVVDEAMRANGCDADGLVPCRHEWRVLTASAIVRLVLAVFGIALLVASGIGATRAERERATIEAFAHRGGIQQGGRPAPVARGRRRERARLAGAAAAGAA